MTTPSSARGSWGERHLGVAQALAVLLLVAALVLAVLVWRTAAGDGRRTVDAGDTVALQAEPYGRELTVQVPGAEVVVTAGAPVETLDRDLLEIDYDDPQWDDRRDLAAADDGRLVPLTWLTRPVGGFLSEGSTSPIEIRLVAGERRVDLDSVVLAGASPSIEGHSVAVAVDSGTEAADVTIEVEFEGVTQTAHLASGEIDAGVAQGLYDGNRNYTTDCNPGEDGEPSCQLTAAAGSPLRPERATLVPSFVTLYPYDADLGWAEEGTLWAGVRLQLLGVSSVEDAAGRTRLVTRSGAPTVTLDGAEPVHTDGLKAAEYDSYGRVVFRVAADAEPRELTVEQVASLSGRASPRELTVSARLELAPVG